MREALAAFRGVYEEYLREPTKEKRSAVIRAMPDAEEALAAGGGGYRMTDPPAMGPYRQEYRGLAATAFLHETGWGQVHGREPYEYVLEGMEQADAVLAAAERKAARRGTGEPERKPVKASQTWAEVAQGKQSHPQRWMHNPWVVTVGGTIVAGLILYLVFGIS